VAGDAGERAALAALSALLVITAGWWALALWPLPDRAPEWLARARTACFGSDPSGLPDASGWVLLIGQPAGMLAALLIVWGGSVAGGLRRVAASRAGRAALTVCAASLLVAAGAVFARVSEARARAAPIAVEQGADTTDLVRLDSQAPPLELVDQRGRTLSLSDLRGRVVILTFAYGHCETVCPLTVREVVRAARIAADVAPAVVVVTLDPWRDTPSRLRHLAVRWGLEPNGFVLGGSPAQVERTLDDWSVARDRNSKTGELVHGTTVYILDRVGRLAYAAAPRAHTLAELVHRL
jgi:protein SCO1/2